MGGMARAFTTEASLTAETLFQFFELSGIQIISLRTPQVCAELHTLAGLKSKAFPCPCVKR
jgi:hypothetical protein